MMEAIATGVTNCIGFVGDVVTAIFTAEGSLSALLPVIGLQIGMGVIGFGIAKVKGLTWGF